MSCDDDCLARCRECENYQPTGYKLGLCAETGLGVIGRSSPPDSCPLDDCEDS